MSQPDLLTPQEIEETLVRYERYLWKIAGDILRDRSSDNSLMEDLVSEIRFSFYRSLCVFDKSRGVKLTTFALPLMIRQARRWLVRYDRHGFKFLKGKAPRISRLDSPLVAQDLLLLETIEGREREPHEQLACDDLIESLDPPYRRVVYLRHVLNWTYESISRDTGLSPYSVPRVYKKGMKLLREKLQNAHENVEKKAVA